MIRNFIEIPSSVTIEVESGVEIDAVFRCRHQCIEAVISWLMNGRLNPDVVDGFIRDSNGIRIETLTIPAIPKYNGTEVVCVATFIDRSPSEVTPPANFIGIYVGQSGFYLYYSDKTLGWKCNTPVSIF